LKIAILGAGVTGLSLARFLIDGGIPAGSVHLFEAASSPGGLCASKTVDGFTYDVTGGHILYSKDRATMDWMQEQAGGPDAFVQKERHTRIRFGQRWVNYPFENGLGDLPPDANYECLSGYVQAWHERQMSKSTAPKDSARGSAGASAGASRSTSWTPTTRRSGSATSTS
jgi:protoporphyrinogen oxidase